MGRNFVPPHPHMQGGITSYEDSFIEAMYLPAPTRFTPAPHLFRPSFSAASRATEQAVAPGTFSHLLSKFSHVLPALRFQP